MFDLVVFKIKMLNIVLKTNRFFLGNADITCFKDTLSTMPNTPLRINRRRE